MKKISLGLASCMLLFMFLLNSCAKEGPAGATGPAGPAGPAGQAGPAGVAGPAGTANVIYSAWLDVAYAPDTVMTGTKIDTVGFSANIPAPKITTALLTNGELKVYFNLNTAATPVIVPLPYFDIYTNFSINPTFYVNNSGAGAINLYATINAGTVTQAGVKYQQYRYILIPGGVPARNIINWNKYEDVKAFLNLPD